MKYLTLSLVLLFAVTSSAQVGFKQFPSPINSFNGIDLNGMSGMALDDTGRVWLSYKGYYITQNVFVSSKLQLLTLGSDSVWKEASVPGISYVSDVQFVDHFLYISTNKGLLRKLGNNWQNFVAPGENSGADTINNFLVKGKNIYMATQTGIHHCMLNPLGKETWRKYQSSNSTLPTNKIYDIAIDAQGVFWLASNIGVVKFNPANNDYKVYNKTNSDFFTDTVFSIKVLPNGDIWAGTAITNSSSFNSISTLGSPGLFKLLNDRFYNLHDILGYCNYTFMPVTPNIRLYSKGNSILFFALAQTYGFTQYSMFETNGFTLIRTGLPIFSQMLDVGHFMCFGSNRILFSKFRNLSQVYELNPSLYPNDSAYSKYLSGVNTKNSIYNPHPAQININQLKGSIYLQGDMFSNFLSRQDALSTKRESCKFLQGPASIWMGGRSDSGLHVAAGTYRQSGIDFAPGPLKMGSATNDSLTIAKFQKIWKIETRMIDEFKESYMKPGYTIHPDILSWPAHGDSSNGYAAKLAPFVDLNNNGKYEPTLGDYPQIRGEQELFWIFNDVLPFHSESSGSVLGVEVHGSVYGYSCNTLPAGDENEVVNQTLFFRYKIINRSNRIYNGFTAGFWNSMSLGNYIDDRAACNPKGNYVYFYNGDSMDEGKGGFGKRIPACAWVVLKGLSDSITDAQPLKKFMVYNNDFSVTGNPKRAEHYYNYLRGRWKDGKPVVYGNSVADSNNVYMFPGADDLLGRPNWFDTSPLPSNADKRMVIGLDEIVFKPGDEKTIEFAFVYTDANSDSVTETLDDLKKDVTKVQAWHKANNYPTCSQIPIGLLNQTGTTYSLVIYPNPTTGTLQVEMGSNRVINTVKVYDLSGKLVYQKTQKNIENISLSFLDNGIYLLTAETSEGMLGHAKIMVQH